MDTDSKQAGGSSPQPGAPVSRFDDPVEFEAARRAFYAKALENQRTRLGPAGQEIARSNYKSWTLQPNESRRAATEIGLGRPFTDVWLRPGIDVKHASIAVMTTMLCLRLWDQLRVHIGVALSVGLTEEEVMEMIIHLSFYTGAPQAATGMALARKVFAERRAAADAALASAES